MTEEFRKKKEWSLLRCDGSFTFSGSPNTPNSSPGRINQSSCFKYVKTIIKCLLAPLFKSDQESSSHLHNRKNPNLSLNTKLTSVISTSLANVNADCLTHGFEKAEKWRKHTVWCGSLRHESLSKKKRQNGAVRLMHVQRHDSHNVQVIREKDS